ncbi:MAG TPA: aminotransferase class I/II-fold pyridoxal phosphate-dependent enzyme [Candidatus Baltobacteraceae bacterium]|nr:aminotransferase class I/II-fold pyridoxal phosphate-dependent enzyme [Candidatus Baltobacteraceae bacterium]
MLRTFASDNNAPIAEEILQAIISANVGDAVSYGDDPLTERALAQLRAVFGEDSDAYFVFNGTGANVVALSCLVKPFEAVLCPATAHLQTDECGAFERFAGCKVLPVPSPDSKLHVDDLRPYTLGGHDEHHVQPRVISISQSTEFGTLYTPAELRDLCSFAHEHGWLVHLDGARIANAAAALGLGLRESTRNLGVDVLSFGGTKNGLLLGEAIVFFDRTLHQNIAPFARKQGMQLASKMRYIAVQFSALLEHDRWRKYAAHANAMARRLANQVSDIPGVRITRPVECNAVFATLDRQAIPRITERYFFYVFEESLPEVRWMTHHATTEADVDAFAAAIRQAVAVPAG